MFLLTFGFVLVAEVARSAIAACLIQLCKELTWIEISMICCDTLFSDLIYTEENRMVTKHTEI